MGIIKTDDLIEEQKNLNGKKSLLKESDDFITSIKSHLSRYFRKKNNEDSSFQMQTYLENEKELLIKVFCHIEKISLNIVKVSCNKNFEKCFIILYFFYSNTF